MTSTVDPRAAVSEDALSSDGTKPGGAGSDGHGPSRLMRAVAARRAAASAPAPESAEPRLGELVGRATKDLSELMRGEIALAKAEVKHDVKQAATGGGMFGAAALCGVFALLMFSVAAVFGIHETGLSLVFCWLIVGGAYLLITMIAGGLGMLHMKRLRGARSTKRSAEASIAMLKRAH